MSTTYAVISTGGKQYRVRAGQVINTELLHVEKGKEVELTPVLMISDGDDLIVGNPEVKDARVLATCLEEGKQRKVIVFRYKNKVRERTKTGHRQPYTRLLIKEIVKPGGKPAAKKARKTTAATGGDS
jgi:large subunit ribosomal protein L21